MFIFLTHNLLVLLSSPQLPADHIKDFLFICLVFYVIRQKCDNWRKTKSICVRVIFFAVIWNLFPIYFSSLFMYISCWYPLTEKVHSLPLKQQTHEKLSSKRFFLLQRKCVIWERTILDIFFFTVNMIFCCCNETKAFVRKRSHVKVIMQKVFFHYQIDLELNYT